MIKTISFHDELIAAVGQILQETRSSLKMSQTELAQISEFHRSYISDVERGYRNISLRNLSRLASALKLPISKLLSQAEQRLNNGFATSVRTSAGARD